MHMINIIENDNEIIVNNEFYQAVILPKQGGKVKSFVSLKTGREFLYQDTRRTHSGTGYNAANHSGWDECFPNIRPCEYPLSSFGHVDLPDHGMIWNNECYMTVNDNKIRLVSEFSNFNLRLVREYSLESNGLIVHYKLINDGLKSFVYLTAAHILFHWEKGMKVIMPEEVESLYVYRSSSPKEIEPGTWRRDHFWENAASGYNCKLFTPKLSGPEGSIVLDYENESIEVLFDSQKLPYAGLWIAKDWKDEYNNTIHCFSIQPTNLASATLPPQEWLGNCEVIDPKSSKEWYVSIRGNVQ